MGRLERIQRVPEPDEGVFGGLARGGGHDRVQRTRDVEERLKVSSWESHRSSWTVSKDQFGVRKTKDGLLTLGGSERLVQEVLGRIAQQLPHLCGCVQNDVVSDKSH